MSTPTSYFGEKEIGEKTIHDFIRIYSWDENNAVIKKYMDITNLPRELIAANGWGYPFIPIPQYREGFNRIRNAPKSVSRAFLGHPIYWIDKELTQIREGENLEEWCIRMFYLIDAFGYWTEKLEFVDFLKVNGFSFTEAQIKTYHIIADDNSETDQYRKLGVDDLETSLERVEENYNAAVRRCWEMQKEEARRVNQAQKIEYTFAMKVIGKDNLRDWTASAIDENTIWGQAFEKPLSKIADKYDTRAKKSDPRVSDLLKATRKYYDNLGKVVARYNHAASILELPILAAIEDNPGGVELIARMATIMKDSNAKNNIRLSVLKNIDEEIQRCLVGSNKGVGSYDVIVEMMRREYSKAWNRMRRALVNYQNYNKGDVILSTRVELESYLQDLSMRKETHLIGGDDEDYLDSSDLSSAFDISFK